MKKRYFIGFSTVDHPNPPYTLADIELVKRDILNQFHTIKGERVMLPTFGSNIPILLMNPMDDITISAIRDDARDVIESEPRVQLVSIEEEATDQTLTLIITLYFTPQAVEDTLYVNYNLQTIEAY